MNEPLHRCDTEGASAGTRGVSYWLTEAFFPAANRPELRLYADRLECGSWTIRYAEIGRALIDPCDSFLSPSLCVLIVEAGDGSYRFDLALTPFWQGTLPFTVTRIGDRPSPGFSWLTWPSRLLVTAGLLYMLWSIIGRPVG